MSGSVVDAIGVLVPELSETDERVTLSRWLVEDGAVAAAGDPVAEVETDKATMEVEAGAAGVLGRLVEEGATLGSGDPIAHGSDGAVGERGTDVSWRSGRGSGPVASPLARRLAAEHSVDLASLVGTGPSGRIVRADVMAVAGTLAEGAGERKERSEPAATPGADRPAATGDRPRGAARRLEPTRLQRTVARRMTQSKSTVPDFSVSSDVSMGAAVEMRARLEEAKRFRERAPSFNDMVVKAAARALREHSPANSSYVDDGFVLHDRVNVRVAVAAEGALLVPTVFDADVKSLREIATETRRLAERGRSGELTAAELAGGTFTVSNLGMFGVTRFTAVVNPPQAAILAVGAVHEVIRSVEGQPVFDHGMELTLSCDHRVVYGAEAASFLARVRDLLEAPWIGLG